MAGAKLSKTQRQLTVTLEPLIEHLNVAGAVHRLDRVIAAFRLSGKHVFSVVTPVPGPLPQAAIHNLRCFDLLVAVHTLHAAHVLLEHLIDGPAIRVPKHHARGLFLRMEEIKTFANLAMIPLFSLFNALNVGR